MINLAVILEQKERAKWLENQKIFLIPLALLYLGFIIARVSEHGLSLEAFNPTGGERTALGLYVLNFVYDYLRKLRG